MGKIENATTIVGDGNSLDNRSALEQNKNRNPEHSSLANFPGWWFSGTMYCRSVLRQL